MRRFESIEERVPLFCAGLGDPGFMVNDAHAHGMKVLAITGNVKNAKRMAESGLDLIVAQGHEAGGHTGRIGTMALLPQVIDSVAPIPVLAAGGIGDGRGLAAALVMGCVGVWVGTRFLPPLKVVSWIFASSVFLMPRTKIRASANSIPARPGGPTTPKSMICGMHPVWRRCLPHPGRAGLGPAWIIRERQKPDYIGGFAGQISGLIHKIVPPARWLRKWWLKRRKF